MDNHVKPNLYDDRSQNRERMTFRQATDSLMGSITGRQIGQALETSAQQVWQSRLGQAAKGHRPAPKGWQAAIAMLAQERIAELQTLVDNLKGHDQ